MNPYADPVGAGLSAFSKVLQIGNTIEESKDRREDRAFKRELQPLQLQREQQATEAEQNPDQ